jgi:L-ascorbate metabolism protein UlaG (beta-lactamase superfamily)
MILNLKFKKKFKKKNNCILNFYNNMTIQWYGQSCFKISSTGGHLTLITDPFDKSVGLSPPRVSADIVTVSHDHFDHNNIKAISGDPFLVNSPGEYEVKGIKIIGVSSFHDENKGEERGQNTIYLIEMDGLKLCHLGDFGEEKLTPNQLEALNSVDILFMPVGGVFTIDAAKAGKIAKQVEPAIIIPMHYKIKGLQIDLEKVDRFVKEMGEEEKKPVNKFTIKKKDLSGKKMELVVMKP